ncbi:MAG: hypothetical protein ACRCTJ_02285 [Brevinema sp.]
MKKFLLFIIIFICSCCKFIEEIDNKKQFLKNISGKSFITVEKQPVIYLKGSSPSYFKFHKNIKFNIDSKGSLEFRSTSKTSSTFTDGNLTEKLIFLKYQFEKTTSKTSGLFKISFRFSDESTHLIENNHQRLFLRTIMAHINQKGKTELLIYSPENKKFTLFAYEQ